MPRLVITSAGEPNWAAPPTLRKSAAAAAPELHRTVTRKSDRRMRRRYCRLRSTRTKGRDASSAGAANELDCVVMVQDSSQVLCGIRERQADHVRGFTCWAGEPLPRTR